MEDEDRRVEESVECIFSPVRSARTAGGEHTSRHFGCRLPLLGLEQGDADVALVIDVWMVDARAKFDLQSVQVNQVQTV